MDWDYLPAQKMGNLLISNMLRKVVFHSNIYCVLVVATSCPLLDVCKAISEQSTIMNIKVPNS
jgi:hypothetical protein